GVSGGPSPGPATGRVHLWREAFRAAWGGGLRRQEILPGERQRGGQRVQGAVGEEDEGRDVQVPREVAPEAAERLGGAVVEGSGGQPLRRLVDPVARGPARGRGARRHRGGRSRASGAAAAALLLGVLAEVAEEEGPPAAPGRGGVGH